MWFVFARAPLPDAPYWPGRRLLALVDAIAWPVAWIALATQPQRPQVQYGKLGDGPLGYGYQWWLIPGADRAFTGEGIYGQFLMVNPQLDLVVMMGTLLGIKGVGLDERACARITEAKALIAHHGLAAQVKVSADGGIREQTVPLLRAAGADLITPGSLVFKSHDLEATTSWLHSL